MASNVGHQDKQAKELPAGNLTFPAGAAKTGNTLGGGPASCGRSYKK